MQILDGSPLSQLKAQLAPIRAKIPEPTPGPIRIPIPIPVPVHTPLTTTIKRGTTIIGYIITYTGDPAPIGAAATLKTGTLWVESSLLGNSLPGWVGIPFTSTTLAVTGSVTFSTANIVLDAAATLTFHVTSSITPTTGTAGDPLGADFTAGKLTPFPGAIVSLAPAGAGVTFSGTGSATIYGQAFGVAPAATSATPSILESFNVTYVVIPCTATTTMFTVASSSSPEVAMAGSALIDGAGVLFPVYNVAASALPVPVDAWGIVVAVAAGLSATIAPVSTPLLLTGGLLGLTPVRLLGLILNGAGRARETYLLWNSPALAAPLPPTQPPVAFPQSQITLDLVPGALVAFGASPGQEFTNAGTILNALVDRPVNANGQRFVLTGAALATRNHSATGIQVDVASTLNPASGATLALMAENALIPVGAPNGFVLAGILTGNTIAGGLSIIFPSQTIIPTFPDPYVASYGGEDAGIEGVASVGASVTWNATSPPALTIAVLTTTPSLTGAAGSNVTVEAVANPLTFRLLDVSSNADQWGVEISLRGAESFSFSGLQLQSPSAGTSVFTVPGISWEPVVNAVNAPAWLTAASPDDGIPTTFLVAVTAPAPVAPIPALQQYQAAAGTVATSAAFTLPFGITANLSEPTPMSPAPTYTIPDVEFPDLGLTGARVLSIAGGAPFDATLPGTATCGFSTSAYGAQVLGLALPSVASFWDQDFGPGGKQGFIPVGRIDLSGYGTSLFSDWTDPSTTDVGIVRALFNVLMGRTAHEIITAQTWILPWCIRLQRTITFDRSDEGEVVKHDTGWQAVGPGMFQLLAGSILPGPVQQVVNVHNIQFSTAKITVGTNTYTPCSFDASVLFPASLKIAADGKNPALSAFGTNIQGYADDTVATGTSLNPAISATEIIALMQQVGRVTGTAGAIARLGGTGTGQFAMTMTSFCAALAAGTKPMVQTALFGTPHLPKDGQWSVSKRVSSASGPTAVGAATPVPLTQGTSAGTNVPTGVGSFSASCFRLLDPEDAQQVNTPATYYGIMHGTGTSKTLYEHPLINDAGTGFGFNNHPSLADVGALLGIAKIFPDISSALDIPTTKGLPIQGDGFTQTYTWGPGATPSSAQPADRALLNIAIVHMVMSYVAQDTSGNPLPFLGTLTLDSSSNPTSWSLTMENLSFIAKVDGFGTLLTVCGGFQAGSSTAPSFIGLNTPGSTGLQFYYGEALSAVKDIFSGLSDLAKSLGGSADLDVGFSGNTLTVQQGFTLPTIPLGFGQITNLGLNLGFSATIPSKLSFSVGIGSQQDPFQWVVSPLSGTGAIVLGVQDGGLNCFIEAGLGLGLSISVAVASGSASIVVSLSFDIGTTAISIGAALTGNAEVDVLGGLASASLTLSAAIMITIDLPPTDATLSAQVSVGIHISICWIISISFDGSWGFSETVSI